ncbi:uncharacterized protein LOC134261570 [Saccostrea cucullata]|uniref:uncharacterized protein LOC134261570 n=1 Tax=Saccostrea cuccullata TaxID=36930 RepID=UPI002ED3C38C
MWKEREENAAKRLQERRERSPWRGDDDRRRGESVPGVAVETDPSEIAAGAAAGTGGPENAAEVMTGAEKEEEEDEIFKLRSIRSFYFVTSPLIFVGLVNQLLTDIILDNLINKFILICQEVLLEIMARHYVHRSDWEPAPGKCGALESYIDAVESDIEKLLSVPDKTPDNLSKEERSALQSLKNRDDIVIKKADKGSTVVVLDKEIYMAEAQRQLSDERFYKKLDSDPTKEFSTAITKTLDDMFEKNEIENLPSYLKDTTDYINKTPSTGLPDHTLLVTMDVTSLYTNIPHDEGIEACREVWDNCLTAPCNGMGSNSILYNDIGYGSVCFWVSVSEKDLALAQATCSDNGGSLSVMTDTAMQNIVNTLLDTAGRSFDEIYIGYDVDTTSNYRLRRLSGQIQTYEHFYAKNLNHADWHCVYLYLGYWYPGKCDAPRYFLCSTIPNQAPSVAMTTEKVMTSTIAAMTTDTISTTLQSCTCPVVQHTPTISSTEELNAKIAEIRKDLEVEKSSLSSTIRRKTSADDPRPSAKTFGSIGVIIIILFLGGIFALDFPFLVIELKRFGTNLLIIKTRLFTR